VRSSCWAWASWLARASRSRQFTSIAEAQAKIGAWRIHYTQLRPHGSLGDLTSDEYARQGPLPPTAEAASLSRNLSRLGTNVNHRDSLLTNCLLDGGPYASATRARQDWWKWRSPWNPCRHSASQNVDTAPCFPHYPLNAPGHAAATAARCRGGRAALGHAIAGDGGVAARQSPAHRHGRAIRARRSHHRTRAAVSGPARQAPGSACARARTRGRRIGAEQKDRTTRPRVAGIGSGSRIRGTCPNGVPHHQAHAPVGCSV